MRSQEEKKKYLKNGSYSATLSVFVVVALILLNLIVSNLPSTWIKFDWSEQQRLNFSQQTKDVVKNLEQNVTIYFLTQQGQEDTAVEELIEKYAGMSSKIDVVTKDTALNPDFTKEYTEDAVVDNSLIVQSGSRYKVIKNEEIYKQVLSGQNSAGADVYTTEFDGEGQVTSAIDFVTSENLPIVYTMVGHDEAELSEDIISKINQDNLEVQKLSMLTVDAIPKDCDTLIFNGPLKDLSDNEAQMVEAYLNRGGKMIYIADYLAKDMTNFEAILGKYGISFEEGVAIETDSNYYMTYQGQAVPYFIVPKINSHVITDPLINNSMPVIAPMSSCIKVETTENVSIDTLLLTSGKTYAMDPNATVTDLEGMSTSARRVGVLVEAYSDTNEKTQIMVFGSKEMFADEFTAMVTSGNHDLLLNTLGYLCEHESAISIRGKSMASSYLQITSGQANFWAATIMVVIPIALVTCGIVIWLKRRK